MQPTAGRLAYSGSSLGVAHDLAQLIVVKPHRIYPQLRVAQLRVARRPLGQGTVIVLHDNLRSANVQRTLSFSAGSRRRAKTVHS
jgi:hypothetical protein